MARQLSIRRVNSIPPGRRTRLPSLANTQWPGIFSVFNPSPGRASAVGFSMTSIILLSRQDQLWTFTEEQPWQAAEQQTRSTKTHQTARNGCRNSSYFGLFRGSLQCSCRSSLFFHQPATQLLPLRERLLPLMAAEQLWLFFPDAATLSLVRNKRTRLRPRRIWCRRSFASNAESASDLSA